MFKRSDPFPFDVEVGSRITMLCEGFGETDDGEEITTPIGATAEVAFIDHYGPKQGWAVTVVIDGKITNVIDQGDEGHLTPWPPFKRIGV